MVVTGVSFANKVRGKNTQQKWQRKKVDTEVWRGLDFTVKEDELAWLQKCYVGYVHNANVVYLLQDRLIDEGVFTFTVTPMGGDLVLIKPTEGEEFEDFVKNYEDLLETWFYDIRGWSPELVAKEREVWVMCQGVPIQTWSCEFFEMVVSSLGRYISMDFSTINGKRFDVAKVLIKTTSWEPIIRMFKVRVNGLFFNIRVIEEPFLEFGFSVKNSIVDKGGMSSSSSETLSMSNFYMNSEMGDSLGPNEELLVQSLLESK